MDKLDYKKAYANLYLPKRKPALIDVPDMAFIMVDGKGEPGGPAYQNALQALYSLTFTIKMSKMKGEEPAGYFEYVVPPLEGLWWSSGGGLDWNAPREEWLWTSMIRQPEFVNQEVFAWAMERCQKQKPGVDVSGARLVTWREGLCVQMMHIGPYQEEEKTMEQMNAFIQEQGLRNATGEERKHHEIYLSDPRRTAPEKLKTVLRFPVDR